MVTAALFAAIFGILALGSTVEPWLGVAGYFAYVVLGYDSTQDGVYFTNMGMQKLLAGGAVMGLLLNGGKGLQPLTPAGRWAMGTSTLFALWALISAFNSQFPGKSWWFMQYYWTIWLMGCFAMPLISTPRRVTWAAWALVLAAGYNAAIVNIDYIHHGYSTIRDNGRTPLDNNTYGVSTLPLMALAAAFAACGRQLIFRFLAGGILALQVHQMLLMDSRGGLVAMIALFGIGLLLMPKTPLNVGGALFVAAAGLAFSGQSVVERFNTIFATTNERDESAESRFLLWETGRRIMIDYPLLGVGVFGGERMVPKYREEFKDDKEKALHNLFYDIGTGTGFVGAGLYVASFAIPLWMAWTGYRRRPRPPQWAAAIYLAALCGIPAYWLASMFSSSALIESCYALAALAVAAASVDSRQRGDIERFAADAALRGRPYSGPVRAKPAPADGS